jgi:RimJ/RimL family protein N-acetyltransferase
LFLRVPEGKTAKNRIHFDLWPTSTRRDEQVERATRLGAVALDDRRRADGSGWVVFADPEGNEFCVGRGAAERASKLASAMLRSLRGSGAVRRAARTGPDGETSPRCRRGRHVLLMPGLRLQTPTIWDSSIMMAAASDPQAQRWLGWRHQDLVPESNRERLLANQPGRGTILLESSMARSRWLVAVNPEDGQLAGALACNLDTGEIGGWLAPGFRGRGLGSSLFAAAAEFGHHHLGIASIRAGADVGHIACIAALTSAGFIPGSGPSTHTLPSGRVIPSRWFRHEAAASRCR